MGEILQLKEALVEVGSRVVVELKYGRTLSFTLTEPNLGDPDRGLVSCDAPLGKAILGKKEGEEVTYKVGEQTLGAKVIKVSRTN